MRKPEAKLMSAIFCYRIFPHRYSEYGVALEDEGLEESVNGVSLRDALNGAIASLSLIGGPRQRSISKRVIELRFGFGCDHGHTLKSIGLEFNLTTERIRQVEAKALRCLRHPSRSKALEAYIKKAE